MRQTGREKFQPSEYCEAFDEHNVYDDYDDDDYDKGDDDVIIMRNPIPDRLGLT